MALFGQYAVEADLAMAQQDVLVANGLLKPPALASVPWANLRVCPYIKESGSSREEAAEELTTITAWRVGETIAPKVDYIWIIGGLNYNIVLITKILSDDEDSNYCVYECRCRRKP